MTERSIFDVARSVKADCRNMHYPPWVDESNALAEYVLSLEPKPGHLTFLDALRHLQAHPDAWIRPVGVKGGAYTLGCEKSWGTGALLLVPSPRGGVAASMPRLRVLLDTWEIVTPEQVNAE